MDTIDDVEQDIPEDDFLDTTKLENDVDIFLKGFFQKTREIIEFEDNQIRKYNLVEPEVDYVRVRRFLISAINNLKTIDATLVKGLLAKLYKDEESLYEAYLEYQSLNRITEIVFERNFLANIPKYQQLKGDIELTRANISGLDSHIKNIDSKVISLKIKLEDSPRDQKLQQEFKQYNTRLADSYHNLAKSKEKLKNLLEEMNYFKETLKNIFTKKYESLREGYFKEWRRVINIKCYYLDKLLWFEASESRMVQKFFLNADINGNYDIKTYIKYYIKNIDTEKSRDSEWHNYLLSLLQILD